VVEQSEFRLKPGELMVLKEFHLACQDKKTADRIKAILLLAGGFTYPQIEEILLIDERTLHRYKSLYLREGIDGLVKDNYQGGFYKLTEEQLDRLTEQLDGHLFGSAAEVCAYVWDEFRVRYTPQGMVQTLHRLGYSYKQTKPVPRKTDPEQQRAFTELYEAKYKSLPDDEMAVFMDGCHPTFNNKPGCAWIKVGEDRPIRTHDGRKRLNLLGAYAPASQGTVVKTYPTLNGSAVRDFLQTLEHRYVGKRLHVVLDNVRYHRSKEVLAFARSHGIDLVFLPPYSPNLNLVERFWGLLRKKVMTNRYYETFDEFRQAVLDFSCQRSPPFRRMLASYIPEKFHLLPIPSG